MHTIQYPPTYYNKDLCEYLELNPYQKYYKTYLLKKLTNKLDFKYGLYIIDDDFYKIIEENNIYFYGWSKSSSKNSLSKYLSKLRCSAPNSNYLILYLDEKGNEMNCLSI